MNNNIDNKRSEIIKTLLGLLKELDRVCKKHDIKYFAYYGTLLGAIRHNGFIPWDEDVDVAMLRSDYNRFIKVAPGEFKEPYYFQNSHTDPFMIWVFSKIRDSRTTAIEFKDAPSSFNQGIFLDIFPLDEVPDGERFPENIYNMEKEIWLSIVVPDNLRKRLDDKGAFLMPSDVLYSVLNMPLNERFKVFEEFVSSNQVGSKRVNLITSEFGGAKNSKLKAWHESTIDMPFEDITIPVPVGYNELLINQYGSEYMTPVKENTTHEDMFIDPFKPYTEYI